MPVSNAAKMGVSAFSRGSTSEAVRVLGHAECRDISYSNTDTTRYEICARLKGPLKDARDSFNMPTE